MEEQLEPQQEVAPQSPIPVGQMEELEDLLKSAVAAQKKRKTIRVDITDPAVTDDQVIGIYRWLDSMEFSRCKKTSAHRDFADGVMMAELVAHYIPTIVNTRNYSHTSSTSKKLSNWDHLNGKVFSRLRFVCSFKLLKEVAEAKPGSIEKILLPLQVLLMMGPGSVTTVPRRLENVKPRFLDMPKRCSQQGEGKDVKGKGKKSRIPVQVSSSHSKNAVGKKTQEEGKKETEKDTPSPADCPTTTISTSALPTVTGTGITPIPFVEAASSPENYQVLTRSSTARSSDSDPSSLPTPYEEGETIIDTEAETDTDIDTISQFHAPQSPLVLPSNASSWLPVDTLGVCQLNPNDTEPEDGDDDDFDQEQSSDIVIRTDGQTDDEVDDFEYETDTNHNRGQKRVKRVVKYEYREEYFLNGTTTTTSTAGSFRHHQQQQHQQGSNRSQLGASGPGGFMTPANCKDPKCRGYGFV